MSKTTQKRSSYYTPLIQSLSLKYGVTKKMVYLSISGDRSSDRASKIKREYKFRMKNLENL